MSQPPWDVWTFGGCRGNQLLRWLSCAKIDVLLTSCIFWNCEKVCALSLRIHDRGGESGPNWTSSKRAETGFVKHSKWQSALPTLLSSSPCTACVDQKVLEEYFTLPSVNVCCSLPPVRSIKVFLQQGSVGRFNDTKPLRSHGSSGSPPLTSPSISP